MKRILWTPGSACAAVTPNGVVVLEEGHEKLCTTLWETLNTSVDLGALIQVLTQAFSADLKAMPGFAAIIIDGDSLHLATRGSFRIGVDTSSGRQTFTAGDVISWEEKRVGHALAWRITTSEDDCVSAPSHSAINATLPMESLCSETWKAQAAPTAAADSKAMDDKEQDDQDDAKSALPIDLPTISDDDIPSEAGDNEAPAPAVSDEDHDGHTIRSDQQKFLRAQMVAPGAFAPGASSPGASPVAPQPNTPPPGVSTVFALLCANGHANPTHVNTCQVCLARLGTATTQVPQPILGTVYFSTGEVLKLDRDVIVGRRPAYRPQPGRTQPHIVPVPSPNQEISRTHCEISVNGWDVRVHDLGSNNGTFLLRPGQAPLRITPGTPSILRAGDILDIGDGITIRMEGQ